MRLTLLPHWQQSAHLAFEYDTMTQYLSDNALFDHDIPLLSDQEEKKMSGEEVPLELGILPLKNTVLFPGIVIPITVGRDKSIHLVKQAYNTEHKTIGVIAQINAQDEDPSTEGLYTVGTVAHIHRLIRMPDGSVTIVIQGRNRFVVQEWLQSDPYFKARVTKRVDEYPTKDQNRALHLNLQKEATRIVEISPNIPTDAKVALSNIGSLPFLIHFIASNLNMEVKEKQQLLETNSIQEKGEHLLMALTKEVAVLELSEAIHSKVRTDLDQQQKEYFLRQQIKAIQTELGEGGPEGDLEELRKRAASKQWPKAVQDVFERELKKLNRLQPTMPDYAVVLNYVEWLLDLPWANYNEDRFDFKLTQEILDDDHYGLEKVKERITEYLAVLKLKSDKKAPILCFYGPPGVGKTSLGKSVAKALGREFVRVSLGGVRDEAEIRGHRRTYIGAMPGRIIQGLRKAKTGNPIFMLDEIDKVGNDFRGDPGSALLEVLDPEQNNSFQDHFLEVEYDLSRVMFIATANSLSSIHPALLDRMEIIEINGYSQEEKVEIAKRHLIPDVREEHGLKPSQLKISDTALVKLIEGYTRESGVRNLAQKLSAVCRYAAKEIVVKDRKSVSVVPAQLETILGIPRYESKTDRKIDVPGVSIGLAWTPVGGDILVIETSLSRGQGKLVMTGQLGDVMKESATVAFNYLRAHCDALGIPHEVFRHWDVHLHFPAGAIPKDGPSAGIAILSAISSLFTQRMVQSELAMTGEITLRGKVLPVGGIKEKLLGAIRNGMKTVILCEENRKDVSEIKKEFIKGLKIIYVENMEDVLALALEKKKVKKAINLWPDDLRKLDQPGKGMVGRSGAMA
jgi:ATP-dependent Lon protease